MSFSPTPLKPKGRCKYQVEMVMGPWGKPSYNMTEEQEAMFKKKYPVTMNITLMNLFGMSSTAVHRYARKWGLKKDMKVIHKKHAQQVKRTCESRGVYEELRKRKPTEKCLQAFQDYLHSDRYTPPILITKGKNKRRYNAIMKRRSEARKHVYERIHRRLSIGFDNPTSIHCPEVKYTKKQLYVRYSMLKNGYILGDISDDSGERYTIYYDADTERSARRERNAERIGFRIMELEE